MKNDTIRKHGPIRVAAVTLAQLSQGLYRSTATAFKELVANAFDADATEVRIDTNYPEFDFVSCVDDGTSMTLEQFTDYFANEGIGTCIKRKHRKDKTDIYQRPIIGRLGIGMLSIGQLCPSFEIESHYIDDDSGKGMAYHAIILLDDIRLPDKEELMRNDDIKKREVDVGTWEYETIDFIEENKGFRIYSSDVRKTFKREMKSSVGVMDKSKMSFSLGTLHSEFFSKDDSKKSIRECKPYLEAIWELAILSPLPYYGNPDEYPVNFSKLEKSEKSRKECKKAYKFIHDRQKQFLENKFRIIFDGIELRRHIQLPTNPASIPRLYFIEFEDKIYKHNLKFSGYLFAQIPNAIKPLELNGIQIRLRGVGIGGYDSTFLKYYKQIETIRSRWVSGEIFVDDGLELALNIDRDSFNEHSEHYKKMQSVIHDKLDDVFNEIDLKARNRREKIRSNKEKFLNKSMEKIVEQGSMGKFKLVRRNLAKDDPPVVVDEREGEIIINTSSHPLRKKKANTIYRAVELAYKIAKYISKSDLERDELFQSLLKDIFNELI